MADPVVIVCDANAWTKVADNVRVGMISILSTVPSQYLQVYRDAGGSAPTGDPGAEANEILEDEITISHSSNLDVYIYARGGEGLVRVST